MNFSGVFKATYSSKVRTSLCPIKFVEKFLGSEFTIFGGVISFGPPVGVTMVAQAITKSVIANGINNFKIRWKYLCRPEGIYTGCWFCKDRKNSASNSELLYSEGRLKKTYYPFTLIKANAIMKK